MINPQNPISALADRLVKIVASFGADGESLTPTTTVTFEVLRELLGRPDATVDELLDAVGPMRRMLRAGLCNTVNPTQLEAGFKANVVPGSATATIDGRFLPGAAEEFQGRLRSLAGADATVESVYFGDAVEADPGASLLQVIGSALSAEDEAAVVVPYLSTAFTDAKWISKLGVPCYGFAPLLLPDDLDFTALFHGVDERVPVDALEFGTRVLARLFTRY
jgi:acetylornithine deacetylase/succinyl-diaminopimelate desuccinylase-like protein